MDTLNINLEFWNFNRNYNRKGKPETLKNICNTETYMKYSNIHKYTQNVLGTLGTHTQTKTSGSKKKNQ